MSSEGRCDQGVAQAEFRCKNDGCISKGGQDYEVSQPVVTDDDVKLMMNKRQ
jgi:hypothetical protein